MRCIDQGPLAAQAGKTLIPPEEVLTDFASCLSVETGYQRTNFERR
jgi:hypothetical protein